MATTWQHGTIGEDGVGSRTVAAWNDDAHRRRGDSDLWSAQAVTGDAAVMRILLHVAAAGVDDHAAGVFLRCLANERGESCTEAAAALAGASGRVSGRADAGLLSIVNRWIEDLAPAATPPRKLRRFLLGHALLHE